MLRSRKTAVTAAALVAATSIALVQAQNQSKKNLERSVKESDVPAAAMAALKNLAGGNAITEIEEEIKGSQQSYEAGWRTARGKFQAAVTDGGDLIELEEAIGRESVPKAASAAAHKVAGNKTPIRWVKKTFVVYEAKFKKNDKHHELLFNAGGLSSGCDDEDQGAGDDSDDDED